MKYLLIVVTLIATLAACSNQTPFYGEYSEPPSNTNSLQSTVGVQQLKEGTMIPCNDENSKPLSVPDSGHMVLRFAVPITATTGLVSVKGYYYCTDRTIKMKTSDCSLVAETKVENSELTKLLVEHLYSNDLLGAFLSDLYGYTKTGIGSWQKITGQLVEEARSYVLLGGLCLK